MRPSLPELELFATLLSDLVVNGTIERVWRPTPTSILLELRGLNKLRTSKKPRLFIDLEHNAPWVAVTTRWPETPKAPDRETLELRKHLENRKIVAVGVENDRRLVLSCLGDVSLVVQLAGRYPQAGVLGPQADASEPPLCTLLPTREVRDDGSPPLKPTPLAPTDATTDWLLAWGDALWAAADNRAETRRRTELETQLRRALSKKRQHLEALRSDLAKTESRHGLLADGELLKTVLHSVQPESDSVEVMDWSTDPPATRLLTLDPAMSGPENLERLFTRYKKLQRQNKSLVPQLEATDLAVVELELLEMETKAAATPAAFEALELRLVELGLGPAAPQAQRRREGTGKSEARLPYRRFVAVDGSDILVGRSARDNDALTFKVARGADIFLHARDVAGSHVILCHRRRGDPHPEALLDAAVLAAWSSKARNDTLIDVLWTERKNVKKVRGGAPGLVQTAVPRTLTVRPDQARIDRLYTSLDPHERDT